MLDANILIRAVLGRRVKQIIATYGTRVELFAPDLAFREAHEHLSQILVKRHESIDIGLALLNSLRDVIRTVDAETYSVFEAEARTAFACATKMTGLCWPLLSS